MSGPVLRASRRRERQARRTVTLITAGGGRKRGGAHRPEACVVSADPEVTREITRVCTSCCQGCDPSCEGPTTCAERGWGEVDRLRSESKVVPEPIGVTYCTTHHGLREADESRGCAWQNDEPEQACQFVELYRGTEVVDTYLDPAYEEDEDDA